MQYIIKYTAISFQEPWGGSLGLYYLVLIAAMVAIYKGDLECWGLL